MKGGEIVEENNDLFFLIKLVKTLVYTFAVFILSMFGISILLNLVFNSTSPEQSNFWGIISICIGIILTIFFLNRCHKYNFCRCNDICYVYIF